MKKINVTVTGGLGRMGQLLIKYTQKDKKLKLFSVTEYKELKKDKILVKELDSMFINKYIITKEVEIKEMRKMEKESIKPIAYSLL